MHIVEVKHKMKVNRGQCASLAVEKFIVYVDDVHEITAFNVREIIHEKGLTPEIKPSSKKEVQRLLGLY